jgi:ribosomal-protein-serine acetyltransferase
LKSQAIPRKLGFQQEGVLRQSEKVNGKFLDLVLYSMLHHEWKMDA